MKIYFDESYTTGKTKLILGALFLTDSVSIRLKKKINQIKKEKGILEEIKYSEIKDQNMLDAAKEIVNDYFDRKYPYFRSCIIPYSSADLVNFPGVDLGSKQVAVYVDSARKLISGNVSQKQEISIFPDEETKIAKTKLYVKLLKSKLKEGSKVKSVTSVKSHTQANMQLCDLLTGAILQSIQPSFNHNTGKLKREFAAHVLNKAGITDITKNSHRKKLGVHYWKVPPMLIRNKKKSSV